MNVEEQKLAKAAALLEFIEAQERQALLKNEAEGMAKSLEGLAELLRKRPETITLSGGEAQALEEHRRMVTLVQDLKTTRDELQRLYGVVKATGGAHLLNT
jgi:hypothetical protein